MVMQLAIMLTNPAITVSELKKVCRRIADTRDENEIALAIEMIMRHRGVDAEKLIACLRLQ